jgi:hypothetical protein
MDYHRVVKMVSMTHTSILMLMIQHKKFSKKNKMDEAKYKKENPLHLIYSIKLTSIGRSCVD